MKLTDYIAQFLVEQGVKHVFGITGGCAVHMFDSIAKTKGIDYVCTLHEQAAAMAADAYSRVTGNLGAVITTSGPGATNLITGTCCSYFDSIPVLCLTGQVPRSQSMKGYNVRQLGFQETDVVSMFKSVTKTADVINAPDDICRVLNQMVYIAKSGRPGPVLLDIPDDVQRADIAPMPQFGMFKTLDYTDVDVVLSLIKSSKRPVVVLGGGVRIAKAGEEAIEFVNKLGYPVALTWGAMDLLPYAHPFNIGGFGVSSTRWGDFAVQNADLILAVGTRLDTHEIGDNASTFARGAKKIVVDIDRGELEKYENRGLAVDLSVKADAKSFLFSMNRALGGLKSAGMSAWFGKIWEWKKRYPICPASYRKWQGDVNPYVFIEALSGECGDGDIIITDAGATLTWTMQAFRVKKDQRLFSAFNHSPMGYAFPASIGAQLAALDRNVVCITGDGGFGVNVQELATVARYNLPIKIFLFDNKGYGIIRQTQDTWLNSNYVASTYEGGLALPDYIKVAEAYGLETANIENHKDLGVQIGRVLDTKRPVLCRVNIGYGEKIQPKLTIGRPIEDSWPFLDREELRQNMEEVWE